MIMKQMCSDTTSVDVIAAAGMTILRDELWFDTKLSLPDVHCDRFHIITIHAAK